MIPYHVEPGHFADAAEPCCFCHELTRCWTSLPDRQPKEQVACCVRDAAKRKPFEVPGKRAWLDLIRARRLARGGSHEFS